jgi:hypothetical protein
VATASSGAGVPTIATSTATPSAAPICRDIPTSAVPVAKRVRGSAAVATPVIDGIDSPTPMPPSRNGARNVPA